MGKKIPLGHHLLPFETQSCESIKEELNLRMPLPHERGSILVNDNRLDNNQMLCQHVGGITVFARTMPRHKMCIVSAFQSQGAVMAMMGNGGKFSLLVITIR